MVPRSILSLAFLVVLDILGFSGTATAQPADYATVEGYVFDARTLRPLRNVNIFWHEPTDQIYGPGSSRGAYATTTINGFYSANLEYVGELQPSNVGFSTLTATCYTRRGDIQNSIYVAYPIRLTSPYQRNFYITLPRGVSKCNLLPSATPETAAPSK